MELIYGLAALQGLVFVVFLLFQKKQRTANYLLAIYILVISFTLTISYLNAVGLLLRFPFLIGLDAAVPYLCGPFLWIYVCLVTSENRRLKWKDIWHLTPFFGHSVYVFFVIIIQPESFKIGLLDGSTQVSSPWFCLLPIRLKPFMLSSIIISLFIVLSVTKRTFRPMPRRMKWSNCAGCAG